MRILSLWITALILTMLAIGCGAKNSDKVLGVWKSVEIERGRYMFVEISKGKINFDGDESIDIVLEEKDGKVAVRAAGRDEIVAVITIVDDKNIEISFSGFMGSTLKLVQSSKDEWNAADNPPVEKILGYWRSEKGDPGQGSVTVLEIAANSIIINGLKTEAEFGTQKGIYTTTIGDTAKGTISANDNNTITVSIPGANGIFMKTTKEEIALFAEAAKAAVQRYFGLWRSERSNSNEGGYELIELGDGYITQNAQKLPATVKMTEDGLVVTADGKETTTITLDNDDTATFKAGWNRKTMMRTSPEEMEKITNPKISHFKGLWILEGDANTYKTLAIDDNTIYRDGFKRPFAVESRSQDQLHLIMPGNKESVLCRLSIVGNDRIRSESQILGYGNHIYRRAAREEFEKMFAGMVDMFGVLSGYWRSAEPVTENGFYATVSIEYNVEGKKGFCDRLVHHYLQRSSRGRSDTEPRIYEGFIGYPQGDTLKAISMLSDPDSPIVIVGFTILDANNVEMKHTSDNSVKMVRSTKEEVESLRAAIKNQ